MHSKVVVIAGCDTTAPGCGTATLAVTTQIRIGITKHVTHIKKYILAQICKATSQINTCPYPTHIEDIGSNITQTRVLSDSQTLI